MIGIILGSNNLVGIFMGLILGKYLKDLDKKWLNFIGKI